jgi:hypothetical protein
MPRFRKKPVVIEAEQFLPDQEGLWPKGVEGRALARGVFGGGVIIHPDHPDYYVLETLNGEVVVQPGEWIITGVEGERYPCKPEIFAVTYEPAEA